MIINRNTEQIIQYKRKIFKNDLFFFVIIFISADPIFFWNVISASSDKENILYINVVDVFIQPQFVGITEFPDRISLER